jgi:anti-sigma factor RsiW
MTCEDVRPRLLDHRRGRLDAAADADLRSHLRGCDGCTRAYAAEATLDELLARRLPRYAAPTALKKRLSLLGSRARPPARRAAWIRVAAPALAAGVALFAGGMLAGRATRHDPLAMLAGEAIGDHLRVLVRDRPFDVESGGPHQVKPWFAGRLDFSPAVPVPEGSGLELQGGAVGWFLDRRAAVIEYTLRKHRLTLLVFREDALAWPAGTQERGGGADLREATQRGFHVVLWRAGGLGHALVSDLNAEELREVAVKLAAGS